MPSYPLLRALQVCAGVALVLSVFAAIVVALDRGQFPDQVTSHAVPAALYLAAGTAVCGIMLGIAGLLEPDRGDTAVKKLLTQIRDQLSQASSGSIPMPSSPVPPAGVAAAPLDGGRVIALLEEIRDIALMDEPQRQQRLERVMASRRQGVAASIDALVQQSRWADAQATLNQGLIVLGQGPELGAAAERLSTAMAAAEDRAFAATQKRVGDLKAAENWDQAIIEADAAAGQFPGSERLQHLYTKLRQEREAYVGTAANRLYEQISELSEQRSWRKALAAAQRLQDLYPDHLRTKQVQTQMQLIRGNAEVEQRNAMEARIHELVKANKLQEAVSVADELVRTYPLSPQAQIAAQLATRLRERIQAERPTTPSQPA